mgnify:CR=1 FL=1
MGLINVTHSLSNLGDIILLAPCLYLLSVAIEYHDGQWSSHSKE